MVHYYHKSEKDIHIIKYGPNIESMDIFASTCKTYKGCKEKTIDLLFCGVDWERKGGKVAVDTINYLNSHNYKAKLHIVGFDNQLIFVNKDIDFSNCLFYGFLNKNKNEDLLKLIDLYGKCSLFLLPTKAECTGIVFCEASAFGLPILTYDVGGVADYVINGENGFRLPPLSSGEAFGELIIELIENNRLIELSEKARFLYRDELNWENWGANMSMIINQEITNKNHL